MRYTHTQTHTSATSPPSTHALGTRNETSGAMYSGVPQSVYVRCSMTSRPSPKRAAHLARTRPKRVGNHSPWPLPLHLSRALQLAASGAVRAHISKAN